MAEEKKLVLKEWSELDKPREKAISKGFGALSESELIAIILRTGTRDESVVELAKKILKKADNNLRTLSQMTVHQLQNNFKGIGSIKAVTLLAALELGRRASLNQAIDQKQIHSSDDIFQIFEPILGHLPHEEFWILILSHNHTVIDRIQISQGGIAATVVDIKLIMKHAIERLASCIILCHNHPSGNLQASREDCNLTLKINDACKAMDIKLLDHIIIAHNQYYSFADNNQL